MLLLEIGTQEIPARFLPNAIIKLKENAEMIFSEYRISLKSIKTLATPRRLSLIADVDALQRASVKEAWGPPLNAAFDKDGNPTKACSAFAKSHCVNIEDLIQKKKGKGTYVLAIIKEDAHLTAELLPEILSKLILSLSFPKSMRWGDGNLRFVRPIHWILATYDNKKVAFEVDGIKSSNLTYGHRFLSPAPFEIKDSKEYINLLRNNFTVVDPDERKKIITDGAKKLASSANAFLVQDNELLDHVTFLVEYPAPVLGTFPSGYLDLPEELLITVMKGHQKYFALKDEQGRLTNYFIIISNTLQDNAETIKKGAERVIKARFEDARFYYEGDKKIPLKERLEDLKKVAYYDKLGSLYDKSLRISSIADFIADKCCPKKKADLHTAAILSKTDLTSGVVREFPELQGIMGSYYAAHDGYNKEISRALSEQYLPVHFRDRLPESVIGEVLSLSDKIDNIASFFALGLTPTGTEDPFALRRQTLGIISILIERRYNLNIYELLQSALQSLDSGIKSLNIHKKDTINSIIKFFEQRIEPLFLSSGYPVDSIMAVMSFIKNTPLYTLKERLNAIQKFKEDPDYESFIFAIKRINNIAPKNEAHPVNPKLFMQKQENMLYTEVKSISPQIRLLLEENRYYDATKVLMTLKDPINNFFDKVFVMDKNEEIRQNRLSLIKNIQMLAGQIADFSFLTAK